MPEEKNSEKSLALIPEKMTDAELEASRKAFDCDPAPTFIMYRTANGGRACRCASKEEIAFLASMFGNES